MDNNNTTLARYIYLIISFNHKYVNSEKFLGFSFQRDIGRHTIYWYKEVTWNTKQGCLNRPTYLMNWGTRPSDRDVTDVTTTSRIIYALNKYQKDINNPKVEEVAFRMLDCGGISLTIEEKTGTHIIYI